MLDVRNISAFYGDAQALENVNLTLGKSGIVALLGPNAAGKSTTLRVISGIVPAASGTVHFQGEDITAATPQDRVGLGIVHVPEGRKLFGTLSVEDNLILGGYSKRKDRKTTARLDGIYDRFPKLRERRFQDAGLLSGGEQQMVAVGRGLMSEPKLLMIDEMSLGLAPIIVKQMFSLVQEIATGNMCVLLVEQHVQNALAVADHGFIIDGGVTRVSGPVQELLSSSLVRESYLGH